MKEKGPARPLSTSDSQPADRWRSVHQRSRNAKIDPPILFDKLLGASTGTVEEETLRIRKHRIPLAEAETIARHGDGIFRSRQNPVAEVFPIKEEVAEVECIRLRLTASGHYAR